MDVETEDLPKAQIALLKENHRQFVQDPQILLGQDDEALMVRVRAECDRADYVGNAIKVVENSISLMEKLS